MRSIFGRCIAIAMMAAIAVAWQSPPAYADHDSELKANRTAARTAAYAATAAVAAAKKAAVAAEKAAVAAEKAADEAEEAQDAVRDADASVADIGAAQDAAEEAREAADDAREKSGSEEDDPNTDAADDASGYSDSETAWGQHYEALKLAGTQKFVDPSTITDLDTAIETDLISAAVQTDYDPDLKVGDTIPFQTDDDPAEVSAAYATSSEDSSAWENYRFTQWEVAKDHAADGTTASDSAKGFAENDQEAAETAQGNAEDYRDEAEDLATFAEGRAAVIEALAGPATAAALTAAETALAEAQATLEEESTVANLTAVREAEEALADAKAAAAKYGIVDGPTPPIDGDMPDTCGEGMEMVDGTCMAVCEEGMTRGEDNMCMDMMPEEAMDMGMQVAPNGVGDLLLFAYWTTQMSRDTLLAITNTSNMDRTVHIRMREGMASGDVGDFTICMSGGDVWTAAITSDGDGKSRLLIGNPASGASCGGGTLSGDELPLGAHTFGYLEAYTIDAMDGGADSLAGVATIVSPSEGFASSYNATALVGFDATDDAAATVNAGGEGTMDMMGTSNNIQMALAREGGVDKEVLIGRWTASTEIVESLTQIVLTFPGGGQPGTDPITAHVWNEEESYNTSPRTLTLGREVNVCTFWNATFTGEHVKLECNLVEPGLLITFEGGWFRFFNNRVGGELDSVSYPPVTRFSAIGLQFSYFKGSNGDFDQSYPIQWMAEMGAGAMDAMGNSAPWYYPMDDEMMTMKMIYPGDNMTGSVEEMMMEMEEPAAEPAS